MKQFVITVIFDNNDRVIIETSDKMAALLSVVTRDDADSIERIEIEAL